MNCSAVNDTQLYFLNKFHEDHNSMLCLMGNALLSISPTCSLFSLHLTSSCLLHWETLGQQDLRRNGVQKNRLYLTCFPKARSLWKYYAHWTWMHCEQSGYFDSVHMCLLVVGMFFISLRSGRVVLFCFFLFTQYRDFRHFSLTLSRKRPAASCSLLRRLSGRRSISCSLPELCPHFWKDHFLYMSSSSLTQ